jgi:hypothetical protein
VWQALHEELGGAGFTVITVALDKSVDDARPWIDAAHPTHPSLIDTRHVIADLFNIVNVPTSVWIDERGQIARPNDVAFGTDTFRHITSVDSSRYLAAVRAWVRGERPASAARARELTPVPSDADQQARAEFGLAEWLWEQGRPEAAERHFARAGELAPHDFTIRRGSMPMRGLDPFGPDFRAMIMAWGQAGHVYYQPLPE